MIALGYVGRSLVSRRSMQSYILKYFRLRKREPTFDSLGRSRINRRSMQSYILKYFRLRKREPTFDSLGRSRVNRRSMQSYILTYSKLRKRELIFDSPGLPPGAEGWGGETCEGQPNSPVTNDVKRKPVVIPPPKFYKPSECTSHHTNIWPPQPNLKSISVHRSRYSLEL